MIVSLLIIVAGWFRQRLAAVGIFIAAMAIHMIFIEPELAKDLPQQDGRSSLIYSAIILAVLSLTSTASARACAPAWRRGKRVSEGGRTAVFSYINLAAGPGRSEVLSAIAGKQPCLNF
jgi:hypothetical protein